jgi:peptide/nickel transport system permease protein
MQSSMVIVAMSLIVFFGINVIGNPVDILINPEFDQEEFERAIKALGLDLPLWQQYLVFVKNALQGDFGKSFVFGQSALMLIIRRIPATLELAFTALIMSIIIGIPLGLFAGLKPDSPVSKTIMGGSILGFSLPTFWVGIMMIMIFAVMLGVLPSTGRGQTVTIMGLEVSFLTWDGLKHLLMPAINLALLKISLVIRLTRAGTREVVLQDYVKFARAKGLSTRRVILVHVLKNILIPVITVIGLELGNLIAFSVVTETVFAWPGMGKLIIAYLMIIVFMFVTINLVVDILYSVLDPRVRLQDVKA